MVLTRWLAAPRTAVENGQALCELRIDGVDRTLMKPIDGDFYGIYWHFVNEGEEVPLGGELFEFSESGIPIVNGGPPPADRMPRRPPPLRRRDAYPQVFLSYRRDDSDAFAGRLHEGLCAALGGADRVFMDQFSIRPGEAYAWAIQQAAAHCHVMIALIGKHWLTLKNSSGRRKLDDPDDYLRREITAGLDRGIVVIPALLPGAEVPERPDLPDEMRGLEQLQMLQLTARHWRADFEELLGSVRAALPGSGAVAGA